MFINKNSVKGSNIEHKVPFFQIKGHFDYFISKGLFLSLKMHKRSVCVGVCVCVCVCIFFVQWYSEHLAKCKKKMQFVMLCMF